MTTSRREFLKGAGALVVSLGPLSQAIGQGEQQGQFDTHPSHVDPDQLDVQEWQHWKSTANMMYDLPQMIRCMMPEILLEMVRMARPMVSAELSKTMGQALANPETKRKGQLMQAISRFFDGDKLPREVRERFRMLGEFVGHPG